MQDITTMGSMSIRLLRFIDTAEIHDSNYDIAVILLENIEKVRKMSISQVADLCYVSQASISRFCRFMGFGGFKEFHGMLDKEFSISNDYTRNFVSLLKSDQEKAAEEYQKLILQNLQSTLDPSNLRDVDAVVSLIHDSENVSVFSHHFLFDVGAYLQSKMILMGKYIRVYQNYENQLKDAKTLTKNDTAVIYTIGGTYFTRYSGIWEAIVSSGCRIVVITQNRSNAYLNSASYVLQCGETNQEDTGKYGALVLTDYLIQTYVRRY